MFQERRVPSSSFCRVLSRQPTRGSRGGDPSRVCRPSPNKMTNLLLKSAILRQKTGSLPLVQTASLLVDLLAMAADSPSSNPRSNTPKSSAKARYQVIYDALRNSIHSERMPAGLVLLEGSVARLFGTSRAPVRRALELLHHDQLIQRFEGRGYLVSANGDQV